MARKMILIALLVSSLFFSCAAILSNMRSSSKVVLDKAPYYSHKTTSINGRIGHLPVQLDPRLANDFVLFGDDQWKLLHPLLNALNGRLDDLNDIAMRPVRRTEDCPKIFVGNAKLIDSGIVDDEENPDDESIMMAKFVSGTREWNDLLVENMRSTSADYVLYIQLGFSEYFPRQVDWKGTKALELGTGYSVPMKWLSDLNSAHEVLHLTGVLLDRYGEAVNYGAEAIIYETTDFGWSLLDIQETISDEKIQELLNKTRRKDLPEAPLNWETALQNLVAQLTGQQSLLLQ